MTPSNSSLSAPSRDPSRAQAPDDVGTAAAAMLKRLYEPIEADLERVRARYREELAGDDVYVSNLVGYIENYSGKMLRPALLLLAAKACGEVNDDHITLAAVSEMIHTATLVHDDILDAALVRRKRPSINQLAGNEVSVLLGDHLFSHALEVALRLDDSTGAHRFSRAVSRTCLGEIVQVHNRGNFDLDEATYMRIIRGKTAELYATSAELGAHYAGADSQGAQGMYAYGLNVGVAFQIMDDLLDLRGDEATVGKTLGTDLAHGKLTLPLIHSLSALGVNDRKEALQAMRSGRKDERRRVAARLSEGGSIEYAENKARAFVEDAKAAIAFLGKHPMRGFFNDIADFVLTRKL